MVEGRPRWKKRMRRITIPEQQAAPVAVVVWNKKLMQRFTTHWTLSRGW
jgi:hypothetical protein